MLTATLTAKLAAEQSSALDLGTVSFDLNRIKSIALRDGTGADQADQMWGDERTIAASGTDDLDLAGSLTNALGATATFARIRAIYIEADAGNTNDVVLGAAASNQFVGPFGSSTHTVKTRPGGVTLLVNRDATGWAVTASTADILRVANSSSGTGVTYKIVIIGCSA